MTRAAAWPTKPLSEIVRLGSGGTPRARDPRLYGGSIPWAVIGDLRDGPIESTATCITEAGLAESSAKLVPPDAVLIAMYGSIGKLAITRREMTTNQAIAFAVPNPDLLETKYLFYFLLSQRPALVRAGKGATQQNISQTLLRDWPVPLPTLSEQRSIVEVLEDGSVRSSV